MGKLPTSCVSFDTSGHYLAVGGSSVCLHAVKSDWEKFAELTDVPAKGVHSIKFGPDATSLFVGCADHNLRIFGAAA